MSRDKQNEIQELAKQMSEAISTEVEQKYIMEEAKLEAVLRANGWVKAEEIFAKIEELFFKNGVFIHIQSYNELKKKYTQDKGRDKIAEFGKYSPLSWRNTESEKDDGEV